MLADEVEGRRLFFCAIRLHNPAPTIAEPRGRLAGQAAGKVGVFEDSQSKENILE